jgi:hypothetical protein
MKKLFTSASRKLPVTFFAAIVVLFATLKSSAQTSSVCTDPANYIYGLTANGEIYPINVNNAVTGTATKDATYAGNAPGSANGLGYNPVNGKFYYFKRNADQSPQEFVSFAPATNTVTVLANSCMPAKVHTGCVSSTGAGYYTIDTEGNLGYYNIATNSWILITSSFKDQFSNDVSAIIKSQSAGDIAIDGLGNLWIITSGSSNFGVYKLSAPLPVAAIPEAIVTQVLAPSTPTPSGNIIAGIAFNPTGQIYLSTKYDERLYRLENNLTTTFIACFTTSDVGNDLTSCSFPMGTLPVVWKNFTATLNGRNNAQISWQVIEENNKGFYIQHKMNGTEWTDITYIQSKTSPEEIKSYSYTHQRIAGGKHYYRIRQVDIDGKESFSETRTVIVEDKSPVVTVWPNPATDNISLLNNGEGANLFIKAQVFDLSGRMVAEKKLQPGMNTVSISSLNRGMYMLKLYGADQTLFSQKIIKQ